MPWNSGWAAPMVSPSLPLFDEIRHVRDPEDAEEIAQDARRRWGLGTGPLPHLVSLFESRGIRVFEWPSQEVDPEFNGCSAFVSYSISSESNFPVILLNGLHWGERKRFTLCHELAHLILPSSMHAVLPDSVQERLANWFAGSLLLPAARLREILGRKRKVLSWFELAEIKKQYGASYQAITYRCRQAGIISREALRNLFEEYKMMGWRDHPYREHLPIEPENESSNRLRRLGLRGITEGIISQHEAAVLLNTCIEELDDWMSPPEAIAGRGDYLRVEGELMNLLGYVTGSVEGVKETVDRRKRGCGGRPRGRSGDPEALLPDRRALGQASTGEHEEEPHDYHGPHDAGVRDLRGLGRGAHRGWIQQRRLVDGYTGTQPRHGGFQ